MQFIKQNKFKIFIVFFILLAVVIPASFFAKESEEVQLERQKHLCWFALKRIGVALLQYAEKEGQGAFPPDLETLIQKKYLDDAAILHCKAMPDAGYTYIPGLRLDMPGNIPLIVETNAPHWVMLSASSKERRGFVLFSDFSVFLAIPRRQEKRVIQEAKEAVALTQSNDTSKLVQILQMSSTNERVKAMALWKLRALNHTGDWNVIVGCLSSRSGEVSRQAALLLWQKDRQQSLPTIQRAMLQDNYFIRKNTWATIFPEYIHDIRFISPDLGHQALLEYVKRTK